MNYGQIRDLAMMQMGLEAEDAADCEPALSAAINEAYDQLSFASTGLRVGDDEALPPLKALNACPELPHWTHRALADWAVYRLCMNGGPAKAARGGAFQDAYRSILARMMMEKYRGGFYNTRRAP